MTITKMFIGSTNKVTKSYYIFMVKLLPDFGNTVTKIWKCYYQGLVTIRVCINELWGKHNPEWEKKYEQSVLRVISDYGVGASENTGAKGKVLGAGYEPYIMAFFIGLYSNKKLQLSESSEDLKVLGQPIDK